jgi:FAD/FMN-containing dehydrogenase
MSPVVETTALESLEATIRGDVLRPGEAAYDERRPLWSGLVDRRPVAIARCAGAADVVHAVRFARDHDLPVGVSAGRHSVFPDAACKDGLLVDVSLMKSIRVDPAQRIARAEPGVLVGELDRETQAFGLATPAGITATVGLAGLTLGGGVGRISRKYGLTVDNLLSADVVTADGELVTTGEERHPDLFWAIRGGGGNFGVATSFKYRLHPVGPTILGGDVVYPFSQTAEVLAFYDDYARQAPDGLSADAVLATSPEGEQVVVLSLAYIGPIDEGEEVLGPLRRIGTPLADVVAPIDYADLQAIGADAFPAGDNYWWTSQFMDEISTEAIETLISHFSRVPSPHSVVLFQLFGGAVARVPTSATAFYHRAALHDLIMISVWKDAADSDRQIGWARELGQAMEPFMTTGFYLNNLCGEDAEQTRGSYGENYERLAQVKNAYDPTNVFRFNPNIVPTV